MHSLYKGIFLLAFVVLASCSPTAPTKCEKRTVEEARKAERALANFAVHLMRNISSQEQHRDKNQVVSPISIALALVELENGANGQTRDELRQQLMESSTTKDVLSVYSALEQQVQVNQPKTRLQLAIGIYRAPQTQLKPDFEQSTKQCLDTQIAQTDFLNKLEESRQMINKMVSEKTSRRIPELLKKDMLRQDEKLVLVSGLYLKGTFKHQFNKQQTVNGPFYRRGQNNDQQQVPFMKAQMEVRHSADKNLQVVELPYDQADLSIYVLLPTQRNGLDQIERELTGDRLRSIIKDNMKVEKVDIQMPRFAMRTSLDLKATLNKMGVRNVFTKQAELTRMTDQKVSITNAVHEAYIQIDENGTEAAAAEGAGAEQMGSMADPAKFIAEHPFIYTIVHNPTGAIVHIGKVVEIENPKPWENWTRYWFTISDRVVCLSLIP